MSSYFRSGRGGAGNTYSKEELAAREAQAIAADPEAQAGKAPVDASADVDDALARAVEKKAAEGAYSHMGRGGAGNWYTPSELTKTGSYTGGEGVVEGTPLPKQTNRAWRGRGGAGNFVDEEEKKEEVEGNLKAEQQGAEGVELEEVTVAKPDAVHLAAEERK